MTELTASSASSYMTSQVTSFAGAAAEIITVTVVVGLAIFLVFKGMSWLKGGL
jgi:CHASE3 domain sensor protein